MSNEESLALRPEPPINAAVYDPVTGLEVGTSVLSPISFGLLLHVEERAQLDTVQMIAELDAALKMMDENTGEIQC